MSFMESGTLGRMPVRSTIAIAAISCAMLSACSKSSSNSTGPSGSTTLIGVAADSAASGALTIDIATGTLGLLPGKHWELVRSLYAASPVTATGTLMIPVGRNIPLTGTYDPGTGALTLSGGGFTFTGMYSFPNIGGTFTAPGGATGGFWSQPGTQANVVPYCGTYDAGSNGKGYFMMAVDFASGQIVGIAVATDNNNQGRGFTGSVSGNSIAISWTDTQGTGTASATFGGTNKSTFSGTVSPPGGGSGTIGGGVCP